MFKATIILAVGLIVIISNLAIYALSQVPSGGY